jgi:hypothetical protein
MINEGRDEGMTQRGSGLGDFISDTMRNRPEALLLLAAGAALLMTRGRGFGLADLVPGSGAISDAAPRIAERLHTAADTASHLASDMRERVEDQVDDLREAAGDYAGRAVRRTQETREAVTRRTGAMIENARTGMQENIDYMLHEQPLTVGALSLLAGIAIGAALPRTRLETGALGAAGNELADAAWRGARGPMEAFKTAAGEVGETLQEAVAAGARDADTLRDLASRASTRSSS